MQKSKLVATRRGQFVFCALALTLLFAFTLQLRAHYFGQISRIWCCEDQTARTLKFARNWYRDGVFADYALQLENPASVEFTTLNQRRPYLSFLPGAVVPVYLLSQLLQSEPTPATVQACNLATQFSCALLLAGCAWLLVRRSSAAFFAGSAYLCMPFLLYEHQQVFYTDSAMMLPYAAFMFFQLLANQHPHKTWLALAVTFCMLSFIFTDWYGIAGACCWGFFRMMETGRALRERTARLWVVALPLALCMALFAYQHSVTGLYALLSNRVHHRLVGMEQPVGSVPAPLWGNFWHGHFLNAFSAVGIALFFAGASYIAFCFAKWLTRRNNAPALETACYFTLLPLLSLFINPTHFYEHDFSPIRFASFFALVPFILIPLLANVKKRLADGALAMGAAYLCFLLLTQNWNGYFVKEYYKPFTTAEFLYRNTAFNDIVFSPNYETPVRYPTQEISISMKRVYKFDDIESIKHYKVDDFTRIGVSGYEFVLPLQQAQLNLLIIKTAPCWPLDAQASGFVKSLPLVQETAGFAFYRLPVKALDAWQGSLCEHTSSTKGL